MAACGLPVGWFLWSNHERLFVRSESAMERCIAKRVAGLLSLFNASLSAIPREQIDLDAKLSTVGALLWRLQKTLVLDWRDRFGDEMRTGSKGAQQNPLQLNTCLWSVRKQRACSQKKLEKAATRPQRCAGCLWPMRKMVVADACFLDSRWAKEPIIDLDAVEAEFRQLHSWCGVCWSCGMDWCAVRRSSCWTQKCGLKYALAPKHTQPKVFDAERRNSTWRIVVLTCAAQKTLHAIRFKYDCANSIHIVLALKHIHSQTLVWARTSQGLWLHCCICQSPCLGFVFMIVYRSLHLTPAGALW